MRSNVFVLCLLIFVCLMITPVMAETINGTLGGSTTAQSSYTATYNSVFTQSYFQYIGVKNIEYTTFTKALVKFDSPYGAEQTWINVDSGAPSAATSTFIGQLTAPGGATVVTGTIGYQRYFNSLGQEREGYQWIMFDDNWNIGAVTGNQKIFLNYTRSNLYNASCRAGNSGSAYINNNGDMTLIANAYDGYAPDSGSYLRTSISNTISTYSFTKPDGLGIRGSVVKTTGLSKVTIYNGTTPFSPITSDSTLNNVTLNLNTVSETIKVSMLTADGLYYNSSVLFAPTIPTTTPTPTQTVPILDYTLTLNKTAVSYGQSILATIASNNDPSLTHVNGIVFDYYVPSDPENVRNFKETGSTNNVSNYYKIGGTWKGYQISTNGWTNIKAAIPTPYVLTFVDGTGTIEVHALINTDGGDNIDLHIPVNVGSGDFITTSFQSYDGSNYGFLRGTTINVQNVNTGIWTNGSYYSGKVEITTPPNQILNAYGIKEGYYPAKYENAVADGTPYSLVFYAIGAPPETSNQTFYVNTFSTTGARVTGALVTIKENGTATTFTKTTSAAGVAQFQLKHTTLYTITASKPGYTGASTSLTTNTGMSDSITLILTPVTTTTVIPTGSWTVSPSYTPTGNMTGFWTPWVNLFSQMGAANAELPLLIAAMIIVMCMILGAGVAGVLGAEVMMGFGAIFCVALGLIPIWVVLAIIVLGFLFYGLKVSR